MRASSGPSGRSPSVSIAVSSHKGRVVVANLSGFGAYRCATCVHVLNECGGAFVGDLNEHRTHAVAAAIGRNCRFFKPRAVGVREEIVARLYRMIDAGEIESVGCLL